jgi:hypothetical protein
MNAFKSKYPAFAALFAIVGSLGTIFAASGQSLVQKLSASAGLLPQVVSFAGLASALGSELAAIKVTPTDIEGGAELLITDFSFESAKAQAIIGALFPVAELIVGAVAPIEALVAAFKS